jgi:hypothetical protein
MIYSLPVQLNSNELARLKKISTILRGNATVATHYADATHINESIKYGGCFITIDNRILSKRNDLSEVGAVVLRPTEWTDCFNKSD